jgi:cobalt-zinc-cadmium resistance protein CzcA
MLNAIIAFSIRNKLIVGLAVLFLIAYGIYEATRLPIDAVPDITNNQVQIITVAPSYGATDIERLITFPIEQANSNINGIEEIRSFSRFGLSLVTVVFNDETDIYWARQQVTERLQKVKEQIPANIGIPEIGPITTGLGEIYQYVLRPQKGYENKYSLADLRTIQDWIVRRQLLNVKGVAEVSSIGGNQKQYEIAINPNKLKANGVAISDVALALERNNQNTGGAYIEKSYSSVFIRSEGLIKSQNDIENIVVKTTTTGTPVLIKHIADVKIGSATRYGAICFNNEGEVAGGIVMMLKGANSNEVIQNIKSKISEIKSQLPEGIEIDAFLDRTKMVNNAIHTVRNNLLEGALIVVFVLVFFLGNLRAGFLVASVIPLSMLFAIIMMNYFKVSGNLMSLGALDFGLIVDGAVIIVEAVMHKLSHSIIPSEKHAMQKEMNNTVENAASKMMNSAVFGQIIILIVYLPILSLSGIEGKMFKPMAQTVAFALIGAFILSLTYIPMMSSLVLKGNAEKHPNFSDKIMRFLELAYEQQLIRVLKHPKLVLSVAFSLFIISIVILTQLGGEFIPALEEGDFAVETRVLTGSNLSTTIAYTQKAAGILKQQFPEVEKVVIKIGSGEVPTDPMPMDIADMIVVLKEKSTWQSAKTFPEMAEKMSAALQVIPGLQTGFQYPVQMRFNELMTGAKQDVVCKIYGENLDSLVNLSEQLAKIIGSIKGAQDLYVEPILGMPQVVIEYNRALIAQYNLSVEELNQTINAAFAGQKAGMVFEEEKRFDVVVRLDGDLRNKPEAIGDLLIKNAAGNQIPLRQIATINFINGPNQIQREYTQRRIVVGFNVRGRDVQSIVEELQNKVQKQIALPRAYTIKYGGSFENLNDAKQRLAIAVPISLLLIFIMLYFAFNSVKHGLLIYSAIPLSAIGGVFLLAARGMPFSISAGVGFIALFGVAVLNGIVLIAEFNRIKKSGIKNLYRVVVSGTKLRLRPVLMTASVASLGFLPMALSNGAGAEVQRPLATVVIGGLMLATLLTLFVLPLLYVLVEHFSFKKVETKTALLIFFFAMAAPLQSQTISLEAAVDSAFKNNLSVKNKELVADYYKHLKSSAANLPQAMLTVEAGQLNSNYVDNRIGINQQFSFPTVYSAQKKVLNEEWKLALTDIEWNNELLRKTVTDCFYNILLLHEKEHLLLVADSMLQIAAQKASQRFEKGESNLLEKAYTENQRSEILRQLKMLQSDLQEQRNQFQLLINTAEPLEPTAAKNKIEANYSTVLNAGNNISLKLMEHKLAIAKGNLKLEKMRLLPEWNLGYYNQTLQGTGADNVFYNINHRFHAGVVGLGIPLFGAAQSAKVKAAKSFVKIQENELLQTTNQLKNKLKSLITRMLSLESVLNDFEKNQLPNAEKIKTNALQQFLSGNINYIEWIMLQNQALQTQANYIDHLVLFNSIISEINFITNNQKQ